MNDYDVIIIGGGPAGIAAALSASKSGVRTLLLERDRYLGGILPQCIHNGFGSIRYKKDLPGPSYALFEIDKLRESGAEVMTSTFVHSLTSDRRVTLFNREEYRELHAGAVVLAMGCRERTRAQIQLPGSRPAGVYTAGTVQRLINIEGWMPAGRAVILGSGDIGMIMARRLVLEGAEVAAVYERLPYLTGLRRNYVQCLEDFHIPLHLSTTVTGIFGDKRVEAVEISGVDKRGRICPETARRVACDTLVLSVGLIPENELSHQAGLFIDTLTGGPFVDENFESSVQGIFAAGNVMAIHDLVDEVSAEGERAGEAATAYALRRKKEEMPLRVEAGSNVRLIFPEKLSGKRDVKISLRCTLPIEEKVRIRCLYREKLVREWLKPYARPAEMMNMMLKADDLSGLRGGVLRFEIGRDGK